MKREASQKHKEAVQDVRNMPESLGDIHNYITFIHVFGVCDTASAIIGQRKLSILKIIKKCAVAQVVAAVILRNDTTLAKIVEAGFKLFILWWFKKFLWWLKK